MAAEGDELEPQTKKLYTEAPQQFAEFKAQLGAVRKKFNEEAQRLATERDKIRVDLESKFETEVGEPTQAAVDSAIGDLRIRTTEDFIPQMAEAEQNANAKLKSDLQTNEQEIQAQMREITQELAHISKFTEKM